MSRNIDFSKPLSEEDAIHIQHRPWLKRDAEMAGIEIRYASDEAEEESESEDYEDMTVQQLKDEIAARNEDRDEDDQIVPEGSKRADLIAALEASDEEEDEE